MGLIRFDNGLWIEPFVVNDGMNSTILNNYVNFENRKYSGIVSELKQKANYLLRAKGV